MNVIVTRCDRCGYEAKIGEKLNETPLAVADMDSPFHKWTTGTYDLCGACQRRYAEWCAAFISELPKPKRLFDGPDHDR